MQQLECETSTSEIADNNRAYEITISGIVQGVGFRPYAYRLAVKHNISGWVKNQGNHLVIFCQGQSENINNFKNAIRESPPALAEISHIHSERAGQKKEIKEFTIKNSSESPNDIFCANDYALCDNCKLELFDKNNRRFCHPFIGCSDCGPRHSITSHYPFDRKNTSYQAFPLCEQCQQEYLNPGNRRFHTQNICCNSCGPQYLMQIDKLYIDNIHDILSQAEKLLRRGKILAIKGTSGYRLFCDATNDRAVATLRSRKNRPNKPLALMFPEESGLKSLKNYVEINLAQEKLLKDIRRPIVLLKIKSENTRLENISDSLNTVGAMLPSNGFEHLLLKQINSPLVATSANLTNQPIIFNTESAKKELATLCDAYIHHNLDIKNPLDDSVYQENLTPVRLGRGFSPLEFHLPYTIKKPVAAFGSQMKNTVALAWGNRVVISAHNGELDDYETWQFCLERLNQLEKLYQVHAQRYLTDAHPGYTVKSHFTKNKINTTNIYHHHAHASAIKYFMPKNEHALVFTWDGTGFGENNELWGAETFFGEIGDWKRIASYNPFRLPGGTLAIKQPWRVALSLCLHSKKEFPYKKSELTIVRQQWKKIVNSPTTSSIGRLFDGAAALLGLIQESSFDAQAAMYLEAAATSKTEDSISLPLAKNNGILQTDWQPLIELLLDNRVSVAYRATVFHNSLVNNIRQQVILFSKQYKVKNIGLSGGVFQNQQLLSKTKSQLESLGYDVYACEKIPTNDANISLGQILEYAANHEI